MLIGGRLLPWELILWKKSSKDWRIVKELNVKGCDICKEAETLILKHMATLWMIFFSCSKQQTEEWKDGACLAQYSLPYDFVGRLIAVTDISGGSGSLQKSTESWQSTQQ